MSALGRCAGCALAGRRWFGPGHARRTRRTRCLLATCAAVKPVTDAFGKRGRQWLASLELPVDERLTLNGCLRQVDMLDAELKALDRTLAQQALGSAEIQRLMTIPGVNVQIAAAFMAAVGDIRRFPSARQLVRYLGLDPRVRQSGNNETRHGRISKTGSSLARGMLGEAAWSVAQTPGPLRAFFERVRSRKGRPPGRGDRHRPQTREPVLVPANPRAGLCVRSSGDDPFQDPSARTHRRRPTTTRHCGHRRRSQDQDRPRSRTPARASGRNRIPANDR